MNKKAINTVEKYNMLSKGDRVLVAVSGGADSMALLEFFISIKDKYDLNLCAAHIEHGIRGEESLSDALFVKEYCEKSGVKLYMKSINAPYLAKKAGMGVEEYSRQARYDFFSTIPCDKIATAHNLTDNAETLLFRLARGTGLKGACAIPPVRDKIIRPFIEISSDEIRAWCNDNNIAYRIDSTNKDDTYSRNLIRLQMLPLFQRLNNGYLENINDFISDVNDDYSFIMNEAQKAYNISVVNNEIELNKLNLLDEAIKKRVIKLYFENNNLNLDRIHFKGYAFQIEMKFTAYKCGYKIVEVPIIFINRVLGTSKMNSSIFGEALFGVLKLKWWSLFRKYPQKGSRKAITG
jgi:tRNA(Ile)-lysidine synthase